MTQGPAEGYRPHLDGLRAVAVYLVLLYHAGLARFGHGFIGVDVFFVLSGYLVTQLLLRDIAQHDGVRLRRFYARRYRRLLPAAFVALMATAVAFTVVATVAEVSGASDAFRASFLYVANWYFIHQAADYFATDIERSPVIHFWSLAVEEQFYLAWPLLLGGLHALTRRARRPLQWIRGAIAVAAVVSMVAALQVATSDLSRAYYGTDTRAYQLLAGALLALTPRLVRAASDRARLAQIVAVAGTVGVVVLATAWDGLDTIERGIAITAVTSVLIVAIEGSGPAGLARRALSHAAPVYLGRVSYGTYLWHWPVIVVLSREASLSPGQTAAVTAVVGTGLAAASFHLLERPVRASPALDRRPVPVIAAGLAISIVAGLVLAPAVLSAKPATTLDLDWQAAQVDNPPLPDCQAATVDQCTVVRGSGAHVLLIGDSNARMYIPTFTEIAQRRDLTLSTAVTPLCPWPRGLFFLKGAERCGTSKRFWYDELIDRLDPDVVILSQRPMDDPANPVDVFAPGGQFAYGTPEFDAALEEVSRRTVTNLRADGRRVVILEPIPIAEVDDDPLGCLSSATDVADCTYAATPSPMPLEAVFRSLADDDGTWSLDLDALVCPRLPTCDPVVDDLIVKRDTNHITGTYAAHLSAAVEARFEAEGIFP
ncbi:MAG: acyltransferase family protein [Acidimicrobiales bacterium]